MPPTPASPSALDELARDDSSRKTFLRMMGGGSAAASLAGLLTACGTKEGEVATIGGENPPSALGTGRKSNGSASGGGDLDILNYALKLEHIEATFYAEAVASGLIENKKALELAKRFGQTERQHVESLTATIEKLGGTPIRRPKTAFAPVIEAGEDSILQIAATVENLGASAYLGQAPRIKDKEILAAALAIHTVEARHAAALNELIGRGFKGGGPIEGTLPNGPFAKPMTMRQVLKTAQPFLAT